MQKNLNFITKIINVKDVNIILITKKIVVDFNENFLDNEKGLILEIDGIDGARQSI
jgi:hypothetical protein